MPCVDISGAGNLLSAAIFFASRFVRLRFAMSTQKRISTIIRARGFQFKLNFVNKTQCSHSERIKTHNGILVYKVFENLRLTLLKKQCILELLDRAESKCLY